MNTVAFSSLELGKHFGGNHTEAVSVGKYLFDLPCVIPLRLFLSLRPESHISIAE